MKKSLNKMMRLEIRAPFALIRFRDVDIRFDQIFTCNSAKVKILKLYLLK